MLLLNITFYCVRKGLKIIHTLLISLKKKTPVSSRVSFLPDNLNYRISLKMLSSWVVILITDLI